MKTVITKNAKQLLKAHSLRITKNRLAILEVLLKAKRPVTQEDIAASLVDSKPNKVTIYRILECFMECDLVHKVFLNDRTWHYELGHNCTEQQCHPHFTCTDCGKTHCLTDMKIPMAESKHKGFIIERQQVQLEGLCPSCSKSA